MKLHRLSFLFLFCLPIAAIAQPASSGIKRPYDVLSYKLLVDWRPVFQNKTTKFPGVNTITLVLTQDTVHSIVLDATYMKIDSIDIDGRGVLLVPNPSADETLTIPLTGLHHTGDTLTVTIGYHRTSASEDGMYFYPKGHFVGYGPAHDSVVVTEDLAYTMSEPLDAHKWMPCNDLPYDKANSEISIIVPQGELGLSNGELQSVDTNTDGSLTFHWKSDEPISTYLMVADASHFVTWQDTYTRLNNPDEHVPVIYYAWPSDTLSTDTTGAQYNAHYAFRNTPKMIELDSRLFGEYPFTKYAQVPVHPFSFGGMEHQSITTINRSWFRGKDEDGIAHELFHQWFGDKTTCENWEDLWLNEGFATFGEALWEEASHGEAAYLATVRGQASALFHPSWSGYVTNAATYGAPLDQLFATYDLLEYNKPGCMLHMLRRVLDDDTLFFHTLRDYSSTFAYKSANTFQFRDFIQARAGASAPISLSDFVNEWIFRPDWPLYTITWKQDAQNKLYIRVEQTQDSTDHYTMPIRFLALAGLDTTKLMFVNNARTQVFTTQLSKKIDDLAFDDDAVVLSQYSITEDDALGVPAESNRSEHLGAFPDGSSVKLSFGQTVSERAAVTIVDLLGRVVISESVAGLEQVTLDHFASGSYYAVLTDGDRHLTTKFAIVR